MQLTAKDRFTDTYNQCKGNKNKVMKQLNITDSTFRTYKIRVLDKPLTIINKTEPPTNKIQVKVNTMMKPEQLTVFIKGLQKSGNKITLTVE